jgi:hypothetical protein
VLDDVAIAGETKDFLEALGQVSGRLGAQTVSCFREDAIPRCTFPICEFHSDAITFEHNFARGNPQYNGHERLALGAVGLQAWHLNRIERFAIDQYLSFFTIQANLLAAAVMAIEASGGLGISKRRRDSVRGALVLYLGITGIVYACLLARLPMVKEIVHP